MYTEEQIVNERTRSYALDALVESLTPLLQADTPFSEVQLRDVWLKNLRKNKDLFPDGWYIPPSHGIGALIGSTTKQSRTNYDNLRKFESKNDSIFDAAHPIIYAYASPVDKQTGIIGDAGLTLYKGTNAAVKKHLKTCFNINKHVAEKVKVGMTFADIYNLTMDLADQHNLVNDVVSITDPQGANIGHTIPPGFAEWPRDEQRVVAEGDWKKILDIIRTKRVYVNAFEQTKVKPGTMITIEPRLNNKNDSNIPQGSFHTTLQVSKNGDVRLLTNFDTLFTLFGMKYMLTSV